MVVQLHDGDEADIDVLAYEREPRPTQSALAPNFRSPAQLLRWKGGPKRGLTFVEMRLGFFFALLELDLRAKTGWPWRQHKATQRHAQRHRSGFGSGGRESEMLRGPG